MGSIHGRYGVKEWLVNELIQHGVNFNDLKPHDYFADNNNNKKECNDEFKAEAEVMMRELGLSVEDLKEGTFYDVLENDGTDLDGKKVTKEEALRIINGYNNYYKNLHYYGVDVEKETTKALTIENFDELVQAQGFPPNWQELEIPCPPAEEKREVLIDHQGRPRPRFLRLDFHEFLMELGFTDPDDFDPQQLLPSECPCDNNYNH